MKRDAQETNKGDVLARVVADAVPGIVARLTAAGSRRLRRDAIALMERPLLAHVLVLTGGNQIRAARLLGINRNTLRKRCRRARDRASPRSTRERDAGVVASSPAQTASAV